MVNRVLRVISNPEATPALPGLPLPRGPGADEPRREHFERLGLAVAASLGERVELTGCFAERVDLRVVARPPEDDEEPAAVVWDVLGHWRKRRRLCLQLPLAQPACGQQRQRRCRTAALATTCAPRSARPASAPPD